MQLVVSNPSALAKTVYLTTFAIFLRALIDPDYDQARTIILK